MNKKDEIINVSRKLFTKYGYKKVSMEEIAKEAKVTKKTIYSYFNSKEDMFKFFIKEDLHLMKENIEVDMNNELPFLERVSNCLYRSLLYRKNSDLIRTISNEIHKNNTSVCISFLKFYDDEIIAYIEEKINDEIVNGNIKDCDAHLTAFIIYKVYFSVLFEFDKEIDEKKVTMEVTNILSKGFFN